MKIFKSKAFWLGFIIGFVALFSIPKCAAQGAWVQVDNLHYVLTDISFDTAGNRFCVQQQGQVIENQDTMLVMPVFFKNEAGLLNSLRYDDDLYLFLTCPDTVDRVIVMHSGNSVLDTLLEVSYLEPGYNPPYADHHVGGSMVIVDSVLYAGFGVGLNPNHAQDLSDLRGKIVAYNLNNNSSYILAFGVRNPFRMDYDPTYNQIWFSDAGTTIAEEINVINLDVDTLVDFGFPCFEGVDEVFDTCSQEPIFPLYWYHQDPNRAVIGGAMFNDQFFWTDYISGKGGHIDSFGNNHPITTPVGITSMAVDPTTNILYATKWDGKIYQYFPDSTVLSLPEDIVIHDDFKPFDYDSAYYQELIERYGIVYFSVDGKVIGNRPTVPGIYLRVIMNADAVIIKEWIFIAPE